MWKCPRCSNILNNDKLLCNDCYNEYGKYSNEYNLKKLKDELIKESCEAKKRKFSVLIPLFKNLLKKISIPKDTLQQYGYTLLLSVVVSFSVYMLRSSVKAGGWGAILNFFIFVIFSIGYFVILINLWKEQFNQYITILITSLTIAIIVFSVQYIFRADLATTTYSDDTIEISCNILEPKPGDTVHAIIELICKENCKIISVFFKPSSNTSESMLYSSSGIPDRSSSSSFWSSTEIVDLQIDISEEFSPLEAQFTVEYDDAQIVKTAYNKYRVISKSTKVPMFKKQKQ